MDYGVDAPSSNEPDEGTERVNPTYCLAVREMFQGLRGLQTDAGFSQTHPPHAEPGISIVRQRCYTMWRYFTPDAQLDEETRQQSGTSAI